MKKNDKKKKNSNILTVTEVQAFRATSGFVSKVEARHNLTGIYIGTSGEIAATDGHVLFTMPDCVEPAPKKSITIILSQQLPAGANNIIIDLERRVLIASQLGKVDSKKGQLIEFAETPFVKYEGVIPKKEDRGKIDYLPLSEKLLAKVLKAVTNGGSLVCGLRFYSDGKISSIVEIELEAFPKARCVIMPMRI